MTKLALAVDDSRTIREMVSFTLKNIGFEVLEAENGEEGLALLKNNTPNLIISDVNMPKMDGFTFVKALRELPQLKLTPVLMLTTENTDDKKAVGREAGATGWIVKPFDPEKLIQVVNKVCP
jgi:two-component system chemotaxis response regulator CheY